ncbi:ATP-binding cassette domain-containing protein [Anaerocolumna sedimenticola]|uniref:ATP-binding cassette domain-containing protein n=1 Tax=Anaerocolumna sedimenticola TaxID=2696063 RepID=A0A6P1TRY4_9FIRM|nr:ABC transporter ATP-binding protein [Anaerocolumna sedimenticola]QHQ62999.1 ATP-binding cassette domain-containing protein [Anaerocolumna sedimenticola]
MENILEINNITKKFKTFELKNISFSLTQGSIMGLIGANGAGKTTIISSILNIQPIDSGNINLFGEKHNKLDLREKENIGVVYDENCLPDELNSWEINKVFKGIYINWNSDTFGSYLKRLDIPNNKKIKELSRGNKIKLNLAVAMSHGARLLILDEITSALDPIMRNEVLKIFMEFVQDERRSILLSSHITTDLEKIADYITFLDKGHIVFSEEKDLLMYNNIIIRCKNIEYEELDKNGVIASKKSESGVVALAKADLRYYCEEKGLVHEEPTIDEIMLLLSKEDK